MYRTRAEIEIENYSLRTALEEIRNEQGQVCANYELCEHVACQSSYNSWAIADKALADLSLKGLE